MDLGSPFTYNLGPYHWRGRSILQCSTPSVLSSLQSQLVWCFMNSSILEGTHTCFSSMMSAWFPYILITWWLLFCRSLVAAVAVVGGLYIVLWGKAKDIDPKSSSSNSHLPCVSERMTVVEDPGLRDIVCDLQKPLLGESLGTQNNQVEDWNPRQESPSFVMIETQSHLKGNASRLINAGSIRIWSHLLFAVMVPSSEWASFFCIGQSTFHSTSILAFVVLHE